MLFLLAKGMNALLHLLAHMVKRFCQFTNLVLRYNRYSGTIFPMDNEVSRFLQLL
ncbi:hypothetical protein D3C84_1098130 [compost metagenome]